MWRRRTGTPALAEIVPPRVLEGSMGAARGMLAALAGERISLEVTVTAAGPRWYIRADDEEVLERSLSQVRVAYPQAAVEIAGDGRDPLGTAPGEQAAVVELRSLAETALPLRLDWRNEPDPLTGVLAAVEPRVGERVVCRLALDACSPRAADRIRRRQEQPVYRRAPERDTSTSLVPVVALMAIGAALLQGWRWYQAGEWMLLAASGLAAFVGLPLAAALVMRMLGGRNPLLPRTVEAKLGAPLVAARLDVCAFGSERHQAETLAAQVAAAYTAYDDAAGGGLRRTAPRRFTPRRMRRMPLLLSTAEVAALWHLPEAIGTPASVRRTAAQRLAPAPGHAASGVRVGTAPLGQGTTPAYLPTPLLHRSQLVIAKTRRGKSTLLRHIAAGLMERVADGIEETAIVVVDPHQDLAEAVLASVPDALLDRAVYLDFAEPAYPIGLNLLDVGLFPDRDRCIEHIVVMMNRLWPDNWGPRMEGALRASLAALHELNTKRSPVEQYTLLDVAPFLTRDSFREELLDQVEDPAVAAWWRANYTAAGRTLQQQTANPVTSKIGRFTVTQASRLVFGQPRSTFDPRTVIRDGGVLVVNTAVGTLGEGAASLVGATMLNLLGLLVEEQVALDPVHRRRVVGLVDESSTLGAVDYTRMLSELGKYGASFVLVTQSLAKLDAIDRGLVPTILANSDGLTVFQASAEDARRLLPELGSGLEVEDLVSLDDFTCYVRWWDGRGRPPAFSLMVDPPPPVDHSRTQMIAHRSARRHGRPREQVLAEIAEVLAERLKPDPSDNRKKRAAASQAGAEEHGNEHETTDATSPTAQVEQPEGKQAGSPPARSKHRPKQREAAR